MKTGKRVGIRVFLVGIFLSGLVGCAVSPPVLKEPIKRDHVYSKSFEEVWKGVMTSLARGGKTVSAADRESGVIFFTTHFSEAEIQSFALEKAPEGLAGYYGSGVGQFNLIIEKGEEGKTKVFIRGRISGVLFNMRGTPTPITQRLTSNGKFEQAFFQEVAFALGEKKFKFLESEEKKE